MHNGSVEWKVLARHTDHRCEQRRMCREDERRDVEEMCMDECVERRPLARQSLLISFMSVSFSHAILHYLPPLSCSASPPHITPISLLLPLSVFSKSHFLSHHLSLAWEAGAHSIYHPPVWVHLIKRTHLRTWPPLLRMEPDISELTEADKYSINISWFQIEPVFWSELSESVMEMC